MREAALIEHKTVGAAQIRIRCGDIGRGTIAERLDLATIK